MSEIRPTQVRRADSASGRSRHGKWGKVPTPCPATGNCRRFAKLHCVRTPVCERDRELSAHHTLRTPWVPQDCSDGTAPNWYLATALPSSSGGRVVRARDCGDAIRGPFSRSALACSHQNKRASDWRPWWPKTASRTHSNSEACPYPLVDAPSGTPRRISANRIDCLSVDIRSRYGNDRIGEFALHGDIISSAECR